jgi:hypothetical protein
MGISHRSTHNRSKAFLQDKSKPKRSHQQTNHREMAPKRHGQGKMLVSVPVLRIVDAQANGARRRIRENTAQFQMCHGLVYYMKQHPTQGRQCKLTQMQSKSRVQTLYSIRIEDVTHSLECTWWLHHLDPLAGCDRILQLSSNL